MTVFFLMPDLHSLFMWPISIPIMSMFMMFLVNHHVLIDDRSFMFMNDNLLMNNGRGSFAYNDSGSGYGMLDMHRFIRIMHDYPARGVRCTVGGRTASGHCCQGEYGNKYQCFHGGDLVFVSVTTAYEGLTERKLNEEGIEILFLLVLSKRQFFIWRGKGIGYRL